MKKIKCFKYFSVHYSFLFLMLASFLVGISDVVISYFICLCLHETIHALVAKKQGYRIGRVKLLATGAVLEAESDEFAYNDEILIAISAPLFNLAFAILLIMFWWVQPEIYNFTADLCVINLAIFLFNMLPVFPLDGGRILLAILSKHMERKNAVNISKIITILISSFLFLIFIISLFTAPNFNLGTMAVTLFIGGIVEDKNAVYKKNLFLSRKAERLKKRGVEVRFLYVDESLSFVKMQKLLNARFYTIFIVVDQDFHKKKIISEDELISHV